MQLPRRQFLRLTGVSSVAAVLPRVAFAQAYPSRPVRLVVGFAASGSGDIVARVVGRWLSERVGQPVIIENRPGAGGNVGTEVVVRASPDGYTLCLVGANNAINATLYNGLNYNFIRDVAPISGFMRTPNVLVVNPSVPAKTIPEFIAYAKTDPGEIRFGSGGVGTSTHLTGELFRMMTGVHMTHVPYRSSGPAVADLLGGQVQVMFDSVVSSIEHIKAGRLRALAVTTAMRSEALPDVPTMSDFVPGFEASAWFGVGAPKETRAEVINKINDEINAGFADPKLKARLADLGGTPLLGSPADFGKLIVDETAKWAKVVKFAGIKVE
jgi:tripartite-type tricarboxylate transporter receptor subunit TctC